ncbi:MAG TPA: hypothetical protein VLT82_01355 [Myxococcaceae bacterium]|nr:hypothetical protein [Myxococcaceae bacterium]
MRIDRRRWKEWGETVAPAALAVLALGLDLAEDGESFAHTAALGLVALAAALSGAAAVGSCGRFGPSRLGWRFSLWRACGLVAAAGCFGLELVERSGAPRVAADATVQLTVLGAAWALLTGWVWGRRSWERMAAGTAAQAEETRAGEAARGVRWAGREIGEA